MNYTVTCNCGQSLVVRASEAGTRRACDCGASVSIPSLSILRESTELDHSVEPIPKLRWYQYRLAHLFVLVTICAIPCSWFACKMAKAKRQKETVEAIEGMDGWVRYDYQVDANHGTIPNAEAPGPEWFRNLVGVDFLADVVGVAFDKPQSTDADLERLKVLTKLKFLYLSDTQVTDGGLKHLKGLTNLEALSLDRTQVSDAGLEHLQGFTNLSALLLEGTRVSDDGVEKFQKRLPNCLILYR